MTVATESGLTISLPEGASFRFEDTATYRRLRGRALKDMDFGYFDGEAGCLVLVELTSYEKASDLPKSDVLLAEMIAKARDSLLMLQAAWRGYGEGRALAPELPAPCRSRSPVRLCFVMKLRPEHRAVFTPVTMSNVWGRLRTCVIACAELLGLEVHVELLEHRRAMERLPITEAGTIGGS